MRTFVWVYVSLFPLILSANTVQKINEKAKILEDKVQIERKIHGKLQDVASEIVSQEHEIEKIKEKIETLQQTILQSQSVVERKYEYLEKLTKETHVLSSQKKDLEDKIIKIIAEDFAFYLIADSEYVENDDGVLVDEVLQKMDIIIRKEFGRLANDYKQVNEQINSQSQEIKTIRSEIQSAKNKKDELLALEKKRESSIVALNSKKER